MSSDQLYFIGYSNKVVFHWLLKSSKSAKLLQTCKSHIIISSKLLTFYNFFTGYEPPHHCKVPANKTLNESIPYTIKDGQVIWDKCSMYQNVSSDTSTVPCSNGWEFDDKGYTTIVTEVSFAIYFNAYTLHIVQKKHTYAHKVSSDYIFGADMIIK